MSQITAFELDRIIVFLFSLLAIALASWAMVRCGMKELEGTLTTKHFSWALVQVAALSLLGGLFFALGAFAEPGGFSRIMVEGDIDPNLFMAIVVCPGGMAVMGVFTLVTMIITARARRQAGSEDNPDHKIADD